MGIQAGGRESSGSPVLQFLGQWGSELVPAEMGAKGLQCQSCSGHCREREYNRCPGSAFNGVRLSAPVVCRCPNSRRARVLSAHRGTASSVNISEYLRGVFILDKRPHSQCRCSLCVFSGSTRDSPPTGTSALFRSCMWFLFALLSISALAAT